MIDIIVLYKDGQRSFQGADLRGADLRGANLQGANLRGANLQDADLRGADLRGANLQGANLRGADLRGADLRGANLQGANLRGANLQGANLRGANLRGANLLRANLQDANLQGAKDISTIYVPAMSSRGDYLYAVQHKDALMIKAGCWWGTIDAFETRVKEVKGEGHPYLLAAAFLRAVMPVPVQEKSAS